MRKTRIILFVLCTLISGIAHAYDFSAVNNDGVTIYYNIIDGGCEVTKDNKYSGEVKIPASVVYNSKTYSVTSIGYDAFLYCSGLTSITIPNSVTNIGRYAFDGCSGLTSITIPNSVTSIGSSAFDGCSGLTSIVVSSGNVVYDSRENCNAIIEKSTNTLITGCKNTIIPNSVTSIGERAFFECSGLTNITIPNSVTSIGKWAFYGCSGLTNITIPNSVTNIGNWAFESCSGLISLIIGESVTSIGDEAFCQCCSLTNVKILTNMEIKKNPFSGCDALPEPLYHNNWLIHVPQGSNVVVPDNIIGIADKALERYHSHEKLVITIPSKIEYINFRDINHCNLYFFVNGDDGPLRARNGMLYRNSTLVAGPFKYDNIIVIPREARTIDCEIDVNTLVVQNYMSFNGPKPDIQHLFILHDDPSEVKLASRYSYSFRSSDDITIHVPKDYLAAYKADSYWGQFTILGDADAVIASGKCGENMTYTIYKYGTLRIAGYGDMYDYGKDENNKAPWIDYPYSRVEVEESVQSIGDNACLGRGGDIYAEESMTISLPLGLKRIGSNAIHLSFGTVLNIPEGVRSIADNAIVGDISCIILPSTLESLGEGNLERMYRLAKISVREGNMNYLAIDDVLYDINNARLLKGPSGKSGRYSINIPNFVTSIDERAFIECSGLTSITIPNSVTSIGKWAFIDCSGLTNITIPNSVTSIGDQAFKNCSGLSSIVVSSGNVVYDSRENCNAIIEKSTNTLITGCKNTIIPNSVTSIGSDAFSSCSGLTSITIPNSVTSIGVWAFSHCRDLTDVYNYATVPQKISYTFYEYGTLHVKRGCKEAYENAEYWNKFTIVDDLLLDEPLTDVSRYDNIIYFDPVTARPGKQVAMPLMMNNEAEITAMQFNLVLPEGVSLDMNNKGKYALKFNEETERTDASCHTLSSKLQDDGSVLVLCYSVENETFAGNSGAIIDFPVTLAEDIEASQYPIILKDIVMTKSNKEEINIDKVVCLLEVIDYKLGDVNNDDIINVTDIVYTADKILGNNDPSFNSKAADMNEDNIINVTDIVYIADIILTGNSNGARVSQARGVSRAAGESTMDIAPFNINPGESKTVTLDMYNPGREVTAFQFDLYLPDGLTIDKNAKGKFKLTFDSDTERTDATCHTLSASQQDNGAITFLYYSVDMDTFAGEEGAVVDIPLTASSTMPEGEYDIRLENILMTCADKSEIKPGTTTVKVKVGTTSSISGMSTENTPTAVYSINGQRKEAMNRGIIIVRMSDGRVMKILK